LFKNERYWDKDSIKIKIISFLPDYNQMENKKYFIEHFIDITEVHLDDVSSIDGYSSKNEQLILSIPSWNAISFKMRLENFQNKKLLTELVMGIEKKKLNW
jgi:ABC-type oligopeptide transport system substrate-binding subunit